MKINGVELEDIDFLDLEVAEKYEKAVKNVESVAEGLKGATFTECIRKQCNAVFDAFNTIFGEGTDRKVFGDKVNLMTCLNAFEELVMHMKSRNEELEKMASKYSSNRASRRNKK
jgi:hypothetical protein